MPSPSSTRPADDGLLAEFADGVRSQNPLHHRFVEASLKALDHDEVRQLAAYLAFCRSEGLSAEEIVAAYLTIVRDTMREQAFFRKHGRYRFSRFSEVADSIYFDGAYMAAYMYGLAISSFLWPNHLELFRFFRRSLPTTLDGAYLEIGPGHGYFMQTAIERSSYASFLGVDISATSIRQTGRLIRHFSPDAAPRLELREMDFLASDLDPKSFSAVVMGEVLEHVERPEAFLREIARVANDEAFVFVTTCINAPAVDHIYLFETPAQLETLFAACGFRIRQQLIKPYEGTTVDQSLAKRLPMNVGYVLAKS